VAAQKVFGDQVSVLERSTFTGVFEDVMEGRAHFGIVAIENSIAGKVEETERGLNTFPVKVVNELKLTIEQHLIAHPKAELNDIDKIFSHPMAIKQCLPFLSAHPEWTIHVTDDTAGSVKQLMKQNDQTAAAISSEVSAYLYGAKILLRSIQSQEQNQTRFLVISKE